MLDVHSWTADHLKKAVCEVLQNPSYKKNAKKISRSFHEADGYAKAAERILQFIHS